MAAFVDVLIAEFAAPYYISQPPAILEVTPQIKQEAEYILCRESFLVSVTSNGGCSQNPS